MTETTTDWGVLARALAGLRAWVAASGGTCNEEVTHGE